MQEAIQSNNVTEANTQILSWLQNTLSHCRKIGSSKANFGNLIADMDPKLIKTSDVENAIKTGNYEIAGILAERIAISTLPELQNKNLKLPLSISQEKNIRQIIELQNILTPERANFSGFSKTLETISANFDVRINSTLLEGHEKNTYLTLLAKGTRKSNVSSNITTAEAKFLEVFHRSENGKLENHSERMFFG